MGRRDGSSFLFGAAAGAGRTLGRIGYTAAMREWPGMAELSRRARAADRGRAGLRCPPPPGPRRSQPPLRYRTGPGTARTRDPSSAGQSRRRQALLGGGVLLVIVALALMGPLAGVPAALGILPTDSSSPSVAVTAPAIPAAPRLSAPEQAVTGEPHWDLLGSLPPGVEGRTDYTIRVYVDGRRARQRAVPPTGNTFEVAQVPIPRGWSDLTASVVGPGGEGPRSAVLRVLYDDTPPRLEIVTPEQRETVNAETVIVRGTTQPDSTVVVTNEGTDGRRSGRAREGRFMVEIDLARGLNRLKITATDPGGNRTTRRLRVTRGDGKLTAALSISAALISADALPRTVSLHVSVKDPDGQPVDGARVTFSISVPGLPTSTYDSRTDRGGARWPAFVIPEQGAVPGEGLATVLVELESGETIRDTVRFRLFSED